MIITKYPGFGTRISTGSNSCACKSELGSTHLCFHDWTRCAYGNINKTIISS